MSSNGHITWATEQRKLGDLREWEKNPRQLSKHDAEHIKRSLDTFGLADPLIINRDNSLIGGHQRKRILADPDTLVDVRVPSRQLTEREAEELAIRLNKAQGSWDWDALANNWEMDTLIDWGFSEEELTGLDFGDSEPAEDPGAQVDKAEELREKWVVESGQLWQLGEHRLVCGDCTDPTVVAKVMGGEKADLYITDPPYNIGFSAQRNKETYKDTSDDLGDDEYLSLVANAYLAAMTHAEKAIVTCGKQNLKLWMTNFEITEIGIWIAKNKMSGGRISHLSLWEPVLFFGKFDRKSRANDLFEFNTKFQPEADDHPCPKILDLWEEFIKCYSAVVVFDGFLGSGTTLIACERLGRKCRAVEISPAYVAVALERWAQMTGKTPVLVE